MKGVRGFLLLQCSASAAHSTKLNVDLSNVATCKTYLTLQLAKTNGKGDREYTTMMVGPLDWYHLFTMWACNPRPSTLVTAVYVMCIRQLPLYFAYMLLRVVLRWWDWLISLSPLLPGETVIWGLPFQLLLAITRTGNLLKGRKLFLLVALFCTCIWCTCVMLTHEH